jgi:hypothetical protein
MLQGFGRCYSITAMGMLVELATLSTQVRAGIQGTVSDEVIREKRLMFRSQTISRSHKLKLTCSWFSARSV